MKISVGMNLLNAIGNAILIFGFSMGAAGAALSTFAARVLGALLILLLVVKRESEVTVNYREFFRWEKDMVRRILRIAIPSGVENGIFQMGRVLVVSIIAMFVFRILFSVVFGIKFGWGAIGVWIAMIFDWIFRSVLFTWRFVQGKWLEYKVI